MSQWLLIQLCWMSPASLRESQKNYEAQRLPQYSTQVLHPMIPEESAVEAHAAILQWSSSFRCCIAGKNKDPQLEAEKPTQDPEIPKKTPRLHELFRKVRANFSLLSCDTSQEPNGHCSEKLVQMNFFILGGQTRRGTPRLLPRP